MPNLTRMIILPHQTVLAGEMHSLATYAGIVPRLTQRLNGLNVKRAITRHKTVETLNNGL